MFLRKKIKKFYAHHVNENSYCAHQKNMFSLCLVQKMHARPSKEDHILKRVVQILFTWYMKKHYQNFFLIHDTNFTAVFQKKILLTVIQLQFYFIFLQYC